MVEKTFGSPAQMVIEDMQKQFGGKTSVIKMRDSKDVSEFLRKEKELEEQAKQLPEMRFK